MDLNINGFADFNIKSNCQITDELWEELFEDKTRLLAINHQLDCTALEEKKGKKKRNEKQDDIPEPKTLTVPKKYEGKFLIFNRITIRFSDISQLYKVMKSKTLKRYHLVAANPANQTILQHCCSCADIDLITFDPESRPEWRMTRKLYKMALEKNIFFELNYAPTVLDSTCRKNMIQMAQTYSMMGRLKNIIVSSSLENPDIYRSPYDVINLCTLFGLNELAAKKAILHNPKSLLLRAGGRLSGKSVITVKKRKIEENDTIINEAQDDSEKSKEVKGNNEATNGSAEGAPDPMETTDS